MRREERREKLRWSSLSPFAIHYFIKNNNVDLPRLRYYKMRIILQRVRLFFAFVINFFLYSHGAKFSWVDKNVDRETQKKKK